MSGRPSTLPAGTVTFLLTDVERSSRLWETRPDDMPAAIVRHYSILDEVIAACDGVRPVEQGEGDSIVAAFARAGEAVQAAVEAQRQLTSELPWLPVRMAIHTGEAQLRGDRNYVGSAIIRCARLRACAHGGQILLSSSTAGLVLDSPAGVGLVDLGAVRLRDLTRVERVWQVVADGLPAQFPPLRSLDAAPHNLPSAVSSFVGRDQELRTIAALLHEERVVTLTGSGGCGKTRLALHAAAEVVDVHAGGTWWVDLAPVTIGANVLDQVAGAVGTQPAPGADTTALLVRYLRDLGPTLLILDNAEHVIDDVARVVDAIVQGCGEVHVLVTSREPLGVAGELVWRVPSLRAPAAGERISSEALEGFEAARLFVDRARRVRPNLVLDDRATAAIVAICARLDGIPLALELAAARTRTVPLDRLASGLDNAFRLLTGGVRTAMPRQQTLLASIAWSVDLLDDVERAVLRRLAVFQGPFSLEAAEAVVADGDLVDSYVVLDVTGRLVDKSLVLLDDASDRYRLLDTIRQFALDQLRDTHELCSTRDRHVAWFADWCVSLGRGEHDFDIGPTHPMLPDVFSAMDWAYDSTPAQAYRMSRALAGVRGLLGHYSEFDRQYTWLADRDGSDDPAAWAAAIAGISNTAMAVGRDDYVELMARAEPLLDPEDAMSRCYLRLFPASMACFAGDTAELDAFAVIAEHDGDDHAVRLFTSLVAISHGCSGALDRADAAIATIQSVLGRRHLSFGLDTGLGAVGVAIYTAAQRGDVATARHVAAAGGKPDAAQVFTTASCLGLFAYATGDPDVMRRALSWQAAAEAGLAAAEENRMEGPALSVHCWAALLERRYDDAIPLLRRSHLRVPLTPALKSYLVVPLCIRLLAIGQRDEVNSYLNVLAADVARIADPPRPLVDLYYLRALVARADSDWDEAWSQAHAALDASDRAGLRLAAIDALHLLADLAGRRGHRATAARLFGAVSVERTRIGYVAHEIPDPEVVDALDAAICHDEPDARAQGAALAFDDAVAYAQRARGERSRPTVGWSSLTPTEQRVAALVATGSTNDDVGAELLMSVATVKSHLTHIYAKVGVANRTELAARHPRS